MKKMSMINTTSSMGVKSIWASSSAAALCVLRITIALLVIGGQVIFEELALTLGISGHVGVGEYRKLQLPCPPSWVW